MSVLELVFCLQLLYPFSLILVTCLLRDWPLMLIGCWRPPRVPVHYKGSCFFDIWCEFQLTSKCKLLSLLSSVVVGARHATIPLERLIARTSDLHHSTQRLELKFVKIMNFPFKEHQAFKWHIKLKFFPQLPTILPYKHVNIAFVLLGP